MINHCQNIKNTTYTVSLRTGANSAVHALRGFSEIVFGKSRQISLLFRLPRNQFDKFHQFPRGAKATKGRVCAKLKTNTGTNNFLRNG